MPDPRMKNRVVIENVTPQVNGGDFAVKRALGETVRVGADIFADGHDTLAAELLYRRKGDATFASVAMAPLVNDEWSAGFVCQDMTPYEYTIRAWVDHFASWLAFAIKKFDAGQDIDVELAMGAEMIERTAERASKLAEKAGADAAQLREIAKRLQAAAAEGAYAEGLAGARDPVLAVLMERHAGREDATDFDRVLEVEVEPPRAGFSTWYELFPRSAGKGLEHGTFADVEARLPRVAEMGFDVLYLPPIHPIGTQFRKGPNNSPESGKGDPGSPWAIGSKDGGHKAVHPRLGTLKDFDRLVGKSRNLGIEIALDIAFQCSPDHPYVKEHPQWFRHRPDGTIMYAENPPKKYQDVYPLDFECEDWEALWRELAGVFTFWCERGVRVFRVDNPHTKPLSFWKWCINEVKREHPHTIFLSEAFTRPKIMYRLAKAGFTQSYTYFTWRNTKSELTRYMTELVHSAPKDFFRPNFWPNTPDILPEYLQYGGRAAFIIRYVLAATLSSNCGIYGPAYELLDAEAVPGSEEYLNSEKYEIKDWNLDRQGSLTAFIGRVNAIRRANRALQSTWNIEFLEAENEFVLFYAKVDEQSDDVILTAVNLDPHHAQSAWLNLPLERFGITDGQPYLVHDLLGDDKFIWQGRRNFVELSPHQLPARIFRLRRKLKRETDFDYFM